MAPNPIRTPTQEFWVTLLGACFALALLIGDHLFAPPGLLWRSQGYPGDFRTLSVPPAAYRLLLACVIVLLPCVALWRLSRRPPPPTPR